MHKQLVTFGVLLFLSACKATEYEATEESTSTDGTSTATSSYFELSTTTNANYPTILSKNGDGETPCRINASGEDLLCILDMHELDLYTRGYTVTSTLPSDLCEYRKFIPYFFEIAPVGYTPTRVEYTTVDGAIGLGDDIEYTINGVVYTHEDLYGTPAEAAGDMRCPYDYSDVSSIKNGKDCCQGDYVLSVTADGETSVTDSEWGGSVANCFDGPAMVSDHPKDAEYGLPIFEFKNVDVGGLSEPFTVNEVYLNSNFFGANFYRPSEHDNVSDDSDSVPQATQLSSLYGYDSDAGTVYYTYECLDSNAEVTARIRLLVREWNTRAWNTAEELAELISPNPDVTGTEDPLTTDDDDIWITLADGDALNDFPDWKDFDAGTTIFGFNLTSFGFDAGFNASPILGGYVADRYIAFPTKFTSTAADTGD